MALALLHSEGAGGIALEVAAVDQPGREAAELDESPAQGVGAPPLSGHVPLVVSEAGHREGSEAVLARRALAPNEQVAEKLGKVAAIGADGLRGQTLLDFAVTKELAMQTRERHGRGPAPGRRYGRKSATSRRADGAARGVTCSSGPSVSTTRYAQPYGAPASGPLSRWTSRTRSTRFTIQYSGRRARA